MKPKVIKELGKKDVEIMLGNTPTVTYDDTKFNVYFGICDSGSTIRFRVELLVNPKEEE